MESRANASSDINKVLQNDLILENICGWMDWKTLCASRQVSKLWYRCSLFAWRDIAPSVMLRGDDKKDLPILNKLPLSLIDSKVEFRWGGVNKCKNLTIKYATLRNKHWINCFSFLKERGEFIRDLHMLGCKFVEMESLQDIVRCKYTPKLISLRFTHSEFGFHKSKYDEEDDDDEPLPPTILAQEIESNKVEDDNGGYDDRMNIGMVEFITSLDIQYRYDNMEWPISWEKIFCQYPNLKKLRLAEYLEEELTSICRALETVQKADKTKIIELSNINVGDHGRYSSRRPDFPMPLHKYILNNVGCRKYVTTICFTVNRYSDKIAFIDLLEALAGNLKHLKISGSFTGRNVSLKLPTVMYNLMSIKLSKFHLKNLNFLAKTPKLKKLCIHETRRFVDSHNVIASTTLGEAFKCELLKTFACNQVVPYQHKDIFRLQKWMPNLSTLRLHLNDSTFFAVCMYFPKIKSLHICSSKISDYGFTGIPRYEKYYWDSDDEEYISPYENLMYLEANGYSFQPSDDDMPQEYDLNSNDSEDNDHITYDTDRENNGSDLQIPKIVAIGTDSLEENSDESEQDESVQKEGLQSRHDGFKDDNKLCLDADEIPISLLEKMYIEKVETHDFELQPTGCPYNVGCLKELETLVMEKCEEVYGHGGCIKSTVAFRKRLGSLTKLKEIWLENNVMTSDAVRYVTDSGRYRDYSPRDCFRPLFTD